MEILLSLGEEYRPERVQLNDAKAGSDGNTTEINYTVNGNNYDRSLKLPYATFTLAHEKAKSADFIPDFTDEGILELKRLLEIPEQKPAPKKPVAKWKTLIP